MEAQTRRAATSFSFRSQRSRSNITRVFSYLRRPTHRHTYTQTQTDAGENNTRVAHCWHADINQKSTEKLQEKPDSLRVDLYSSARQRFCDPDL